MKGREERRGSRVLLFWPLSDAAGRGTQTHRGVKSWGLGRHGMGTPVWMEHQIHE